MSNVTLKLVLKRFEVMWTSGVFCTQSETMELCLDCCVTLATALLALDIFWRHFFSQSNRRLCAVQKSISAVCRHWMCFRGSAISRCVAFLLDYHLHSLCLNLIIIVTSFSYNGWCYRPRRWFGFFYWSWCYAYHCYCDSASCRRLLLQCTVRVTKKSPLRFSEIFSQTVGNF